MRTHHFPQKYRLPPGLEGIPLAAMYVGPVAGCGAVPEPWSRWRWQEAVPYPPGGSPAAGGGAGAPFRPGAPGGAGHPRVAGLSFGDVAGAALENICFKDIILLGN